MLYSIAKYLSFYLLLFVGISIPIESLDIEKDCEDKMKGITMVAPPNPFVNDPMPALSDVHADWVSFVPYGYTRKNQTTVRHNSDWQWWGEKEEGIRKSIELAHEQNLKVMLKPQVYIPGGWVGEFEPENEQGWKDWETSYEQYLLLFLDIAKEYKVEMFCIGTEYKVAVQKRELFWRSLIKKIRSQYSGKIIYSSNWDSYKDVPFWDALDYIGISAYFPLCEDVNPERNTLGSKWDPIKKDLQKFSASQDKQILFTEYGYLSVDGCGGKTWELEKKIHSLDINEKAQANALYSLYKAFWDEPYWAGGFLWKWFPEMQGHEGYINKDYTPQGKTAEHVVREWYAK